MMNKELIEYLETHDLDETEVEALEEWVNAGHKISENPMQEYDDYGCEVPFMKWYWQQLDPLHPEYERKIFLKEAMRTSIEFDDKEAERRFLKNAQFTLIREILLYRRFLALHPGAVAEFEEYRSEQMGE